MIDPLDYKEPACALCGGEAFYNFDPKKPQGHIPVDAVIRNSTTVWRVKITPRAQGFCVIGLKTQKRLTTGEANYRCKTRCSGFRGA